MAIFNSYVTNYQRVVPKKKSSLLVKSPLVRVTIWVSVAMADSIPSSIQSDFPIGCGPRKTCDEITPSSHHGLWVESGAGFSKKSAMAHRDISKTIRRDMDDNLIGNNYCKVCSSTLTNKFWGPGLSTCQFIRTNMGQIFEVHVHRINGWLKPEVHGKCPFSG